MPPRHTTRPGAPGRGPEVGGVRTGPDPTAVATVAEGSVHETRRHRPDAAQLHPPARRSVTAAIAVIVSRVASARGSAAGRMGRCAAAPTRRPPRAPHSPAHRGSAAGNGRCRRPGPAPRRRGRGAGRLVVDSGPRTNPLVAPSLSRCCAAGDAASGWGSVSASGTVGVTAPGRGLIPTDDSGVFRRRSGHSVSVARIRSFVR